MWLALFEGDDGPDAVAREAAMKNHRRLATAALALIVVCAAPTVEAGGAFGIHIGGGGFGVSVGFGDWGVYTRSWSDPYWSIDSNAVLAGYGEWVWLDGLGRVWRPWVAASWRPYTYGRWVSTTCGWTWVSYEPWGYVPHHYGSWAYSAFGWVWVPGYSYSCANVVWVRAGGYVGWYARPPWGWSHASHGFRHGYHHGYRDGWNNGYDKGYSDGWHDARYGTFVEWRDFGADNVSRRAVTHRIAATHRIDPSDVAPTGDEIRRFGGPVMTETRLERRTVRVDGREITIARPEGVAGSIERNAADTVSRALSGRALEQRQPLVRPHVENEAAAASSSRLSSVRREERSPLRDGPGSTRQTAASARDDRSAESSRSSDRRPLVIGSSGTGSTDRSSSSRSGAPQPRDELRQSSPRRDVDSGGVDSRTSRRAPSTVAPQRSAVSEPQRARPAPQESSAQQPIGDRTRTSAAAPRRVVSSPQTATSSRQSGARDDRSESSGENRDSTEKRSAQRSRPRKP